MSGLKHTPGPWFAREQCEISGWVEVGIPGYSRNSVACATPAASGDAEARRDTETLANARLIAAAPEMLEALIDCRRALELADATGELAVVDAALAKATGGTA